jgi:hypothetical protein
MGTTDIDNDLSSVNSSEIHYNDPKDNRCAPGNSYDNRSCMTVQSLIKLTNAYNRDNTHDKIELIDGAENKDPVKYKRYLLKKLKKKIYKCKNQRCWLEQGFARNLTNSDKNTIINNTFRPDGPKGRFEWLNTLHIDEMMKQYESVYKDFKFLGAVPMDFDDLPNVGIKNLNFSELENKGIHKLGIVFNLDEHYKSGSHWVGFYADLKTGIIRFLDSYGIKEDERVTNLVNRMLKYMRKKGINGTYEYNQVRHQYKGSECGVYSINFIIRMLRGDTFKDICNEKTSDDKINRCRNKYFINADIPNDSSNGHCDI